MDLNEKLKEWFKWYLDNQDYLVERYNNKYIVIKDNEVVDSYESEDEAYFSAKEKYGLGNFIVQLCTPGEESYSMHLSTPYIFTACV